MRLKVVSTAAIPKSIQASELMGPLGQTLDYIQVNSRTELKKALPSAHALLCLLSDSIDRSLLKLAPRLQVIGTCSAGINHIDLATCAAQKIKVVHTPKVLTRATAELATTLLLATTRRVPEGIDLCRSKKFKGWSMDLLLGLELAGRQAVLVGRGKIGIETGRLFRAIGLKVDWITREDSDALILKKLSKAQVVSLHLPLTDLTRHWLNRRRLSVLPRDAIVINTSRGPVIDEHALIQALQAGRLFGAGLDVYEHEPKIPAELIGLKNVVLLPHLGSATRATRTEMMRLASWGVARILLGKTPWNKVKLARS